MATLSFWILVVLSQFLLLHSVGGEEDRNHLRLDHCAAFPCGKLGEIQFPYTRKDRPECGLFAVDGCEEDNPEVQLEQGGRFYQLEKISQGDTITIHDEELAKQLNTNDCQSLKNLSFPNLPYVSFEMIAPTLTLCKCNSVLNTSFPKEFSHIVCNNCTIYYNEPKGTLPEQLDNKNYRLSSHCNCPIIRLPLPPPLPHPLPFPNLPCSNNPPNKNSQHTTCSFNLSQLLCPHVIIQVHISRQCRKCHIRGGRCLVSKQRFQCSKGKNKLGLKLGLGVGCPLALIIIILSIYVFWHRYRQNYASSKFLRASYDSSSKSDLESSSSTVGFGLPIFSYRELVQVTNNFDDEKELGDGGFGTVYYGKLPDGREVAIKRLYQHNYRRLEQFINEVEILTRLRHRNLVSLYGCTSRRSRELLLVYEFIPNGTVADHLHGDRAQFGSLTWSIRMSIAIETASALAYLHASDIIHRDVKTNNILLDDNFSVKVADFGLSRLFPNDVTHISTAPQGTPGYVDPEYHQCYQLTGKSDVYSFGVVLIELISSMPAVDITRHRHEINLANLAINKIQKCAFDELIDPKLGYKSDVEVMRMTTSVAELAFRCLQQEKEMRPSMVEVLEELQRIQGEDCKLENVQEEEEGHTDTEVPRSVPPPSPQTGDHITLLKNIRLPPSPISVTDKWVSQSTTPNVSG